MRLTGTAANEQQSALPIARGTGRKALKLFAASSMLLVVVAAMPTRNRSNPFAWDILLLSGFTTFLLGLLATGSSKKRFEAMLDRLGRRGTITGIEKLKDHMEQRAERWMHWIATAVSVSVFAAFVAVMISEPKSAVQRIPLCLFETAWAYVAGCRIGRLVAYGGLGWQLKGSNASIHVFPAHIDGAAGLKPLGGFCLHQALILGIPATFLAVWSFLIPAWPEVAIRSRYRLWMHPYLGLLAFALLLEILVFVVPMWWFHREMCHQRGCLLEEADELSQKIASIRNQLGEARTSEERNSLNDDLSFKTRQFWDIERMPTWPVDVPLIRKFTMANAPLVVPLLAEALGIHEKWVKTMEQVLDKIKVS
jgi:hypothetical protein